MHNPFQDLVKNNRMNRKPSESVEENEDDDGDMEVEEVDSDEWDEEEEPVPVTDCIFCSHHSANLDNNMR